MAAIRRSSSIALTVFAVGFGMLSFSAQLADETKSGAMIVGTAFGWSQDGHGHHSHGGKGGQGQGGQGQNSETKTTPTPTNMGTTAQTTKSAAGEKAAATSPTSIASGDANQAAILATVRDELRQRHRHKSGGDAADTDAPSTTAALSAMDKGEQPVRPGVDLTNKELAVLKQVMATPSAPVVQATQSGNHDYGQHGSYTESEVLAVGMTENELAIAHELGFGVDYAAGDDEGMYRFTRLKVPAGTDTLTALRTLKVALPGKSVALNSLYKIFERSSGDAAGAAVATDIGPGNACSGEQCRPRKIIGWKDELRNCSAGLAIGMIDTGLDTSHPALAGSVNVNKIVTASFKKDSGKPAPTEHGTGVAALLVGDSEHGIAGLIPDVTLFAADAFYAVDGQPVTDTVSVLKALDWMRRQHVHIVNMSFSGPDDPLLAAAIKQSIREGMVIVAAAGNEGAGAPPAFPAAYPGVIAVTAITSELKAYQRANRGAYISLAAPGVHIWTATNDGKGTFASGTSFAAPYVTAIAATLLRAAGPAASPKDILQAIPVKSLDQQDWSPVFGHGLAMAPQSCGALRVADQLPWQAMPWSASSAGGNALGFTTVSTEQ